VSEEAMSCPTCGGSVLVDGTCPECDLGLTPTKTVKVILFKPSGKFYTDERWKIPDQVPLDRGTPAYAQGLRIRSVVGPFDMIHSPDFRRIDGGAVLIESQEPWGFPHLFNAEV
jgi:hypothetical protein